MRRTALLLGVVALAAACAAPMPGSVAPSLELSAAASATSSPTPVLTPTATLGPVPTEPVVMPDESVDPVLPPIEVDWNAAPGFPSPLLGVGGTSVRAIGESGCPTLIFEPAEDELGRAAQMQVACAASPVLSFARAVRAAAGSGLVFKAPEGWAMGAQVTSQTDPYGPFWIVESKRLGAPPSGATALSAVGARGWVEIARGEGFMLDALDAPAPDAPGDYLVSVQTQIGQTPSRWRTYGRTYYYWVRVP